jgi:acetaldehyde dehydrogenase
MKTKVAIIGSGNIGTDLMIKVMRLSDVLEMGAFVGIDPQSDGLKRAERLGVPITAEGLDGLIGLPNFGEIEIVFDATSAGAHKKHSEALIARGKRVIDLTPAAIGPYTIPPVNGDAHLDAPNVNMVTCGGQATIPIVAAINRVAKVHYGVPGHARQYRRIHRDDQPGHRRCGWRHARQGDHHSQSGGAAADHARYGLLPVR